MDLKVTTRNIDSIFDIYNQQKNKAFQFDWHKLNSDFSLFSQPILLEGILTEKNLDHDDQISRFHILQNDKIIRFKVKSHRALSKKKILSQFYQFFFLN